MSYFVYLVECADNTYYCGYTDDLDARVAKHNFSKTGAKYTKARRPVKLVYSEKFQSKEDAMKREHAIKKFSRREKEKLVLSNKS